MNVNYRNKPLNFDYVLNCIYMVNFPMDGLKVEHAEMQS